MTERLVADYAFDRPSLAALKAAGVEGIARYLAPLPNGKVFNTDPQSGQFDGRELAELVALGMSLCLVWETSELRATSGFAAGQADAQRANAQADQVGFPAECPLYFAVDSDVSYAAVKAYFDGARSELLLAGVSRRPVGIYGSYRVCVGALADGLRFAWQTVAWSYGALEPAVSLYQRNTHSIDVPGQWDENVVLRPDWGQWTPGQPATQTGAHHMIVRWIHGGQDWLFDGPSRLFLTFTNTEQIAVPDADNVVKMGQQGDDFHNFWRGLALAAGFTFYPAGI